KNVLSVIDGADPMPKLAALLQQNAAQIGIQLKLQPFQTTTMYTKCETATEKVPLCPSEGWYADFNDPAGYVTGLFDSASLPPACCDDSELGATSALLHKWGYSVSGPLTNVDAQLRGCVPISGAQREQCYANL